MKSPQWDQRIPYAKKFQYFGNGAALMAPQGVIYNERYLAIGDGTLIGPNVCLTAGISGEQTMLSSPVVTIGRKCIIGRGSHIIGHWSIVLGDEIQTGPYVYITDENHSYEDPDQPIGWQTPTEAAVRIGSGSWLGANVVILPGTGVGREHGRRGGRRRARDLPRSRRARWRARQGAASLHARERMAIGTTR